jgi:putative O-methyltransferase
MLQSHSEGSQEVKHPPYHLRVNKAVDRSLLIDALRIVSKHFDDLRAYRYYGLGGPFLEEFRLLGEHFEHLPLTSLEANEQTYRRQKFHRCAKNVILRRETVDTFLTTNSWNEPGVYWLDYTDLSPKRLQEFETLLDRVREDSIVKITLRASLDDLPDRLAGGVIQLAEEQLEQWRTQYLAEFKSKFDSVLPAQVDYGRLRSGNFPILIQEMLRIVAQRALPPGGGRQYQVLHSCFYSDQTQMYSLTGIVCRDEDIQKYRNMFSNWPFRNLRWTEPKRIDMPLLSTKERMLLESMLPVKTATGRGLRRTLGYNIDEGNPATIRQLKQYAVFYRFYPYFARVSVV